MGTQSMQYRGHGARTGGLQRHPIGELYPLAVIGLGDGWAVMDLRSGSIGRRQHTYSAAEIEAWGRRIVMMANS